jgi:hypothetical protein
MYTCRKIQTTYCPAEPSFGIRGCEANFSDEQLVMGSGFVLKDYGEAVSVSVLLEVRLETINQKELGGVINIRTITSALKSSLENSKRRPVKKCVLQAAVISDLQMGQRGEVKLHCDIPSALWLS